MTDPKRMDRREAIKWMLAATATVSMLDARSFGATRALSGYGRDPNLMEVYKPGDFWPLTFTAEQHRAVSALCDVILPADDRSPSASQLKVPDFIDEWISAPYERQQRDRKELLAGLAWLETESKKRFRCGFADLADAQKQRICDDICSLQKARPGFKKAAGFFRTFRNLAMSGFYTTPEGMKDLQYLGNVPLLKFDGPPPEVLAFLRLEGVPPHRT
ncbi:MAG TPA: gluconate 2-dehydrogenase subunit 3 family protein [Verrucomicrobiae bacterium]|nr:gluconate 2-dehydrogenase subunit 3 family protein [Verrucomicrobiae bacterium]